ncbi:MAG: hypothetical protein AAB482_03085 [Patescibacteria group bacterium]|mgnify:CR=1 FL=1
MKLQFFITITIVVFVVGFLFGGYIYFWQYEVSPLIDRFFQTKINIQSLNDQNNAYRVNIEPDFEKNSEDLKKIRSVFFKPEPVLSYIIFIEMLAKRNTLIHTIISTPTAIAPSSQITVSGTYQNITRFLREIENDSILIRVQSVALQGSGENMSANILLKLQPL